jgi:putative DNA primase/helicase
MPPWPTEQEAKAKTDTIRTVRKRLSSAVCARNVISLAASQQELFMRSEALDSDPLLLGCPGGLVVDLRTGKTRVALYSDYISKTTIVAPSDKAQHSLWKTTLSEIFGGDGELIAYVQRVLGSCLTGSVEDETLFVFKGDGRNGKGTLISAVQNILGPYATSITKEALSENKFKSDYAQLGAIAKLCGARLAVSSEGNKTIRLDTELLKNLTGRDRLVGKKLFRDQLEFAPTHKLILLANHNPILQIDPAVVGRLQLVPFNKSFIDHPNTKLKDQLVQEYPSILRWLIDGCLSWQRTGLRPPSVVTAFTQKYLQGADLFEQWASEEHGNMKDRNAFAPTIFLWDNYRAFCERTGEKAGTRTTFHNDLEKKAWMHKGRTRFIDGKIRNGFWGLRVEGFQRMTK